ISDIGFDWWPMAARVDVVFLVGLWLLTPWVAGKLDRGPPLAKRNAVMPLLLSLGAGAIVLVAALGSEYHEVRGSRPTVADLGGTGLSVPVASDEQPDEDWRAYGRTQLGQRFSPLSQITPANAKRLKVAWTFRTGDMKAANDPGEETFQVTPI